MKRYVLSIDQGTTSSRAILFDHFGDVVASVQKEMTQYYPKPGWVEHDPNEILEQVRTLMNQIVLANHINPEDIASIGITNQRETTVLWDRRSGKPVYNAIVWQSRQSAEICQQWIYEGYRETVRNKTGLIIDAYFSASKIRWILDHVSGVKALAEQGDLLFGTIDTWLIWNLTGGSHITDYSNAARSMIYNIRELAWDEDLLRSFDIPASILPEVRPSSEVYGTTMIQGVFVPIGSAIGDQQAALFGQTCFRVGDVKNTYGTGCFLLMNTGHNVVSSRNNLLSTIAWGYNNKVEYALEGSVFVAGSAIQWLRDALQIISRAEECEELAQKVESSGGVYFVPAFVGLGAPYWDMEAKGAIFGLTHGTTKEHIARATLEALAYQTKDVVNAMQHDAGVSLQSLKVDGGVTRNHVLLQFQADILHVPVEKQKTVETTALGAAYLAGLAVGFWESTEQIANSRKMERMFMPSMEQQKSEELYKGWGISVRNAMGWKISESIS